MVHAGAQRGGPGGMNGLTAKVTLLLQRLRDINMTVLFKDLSDDDNVCTI